MRRREFITLLGVRCIMAACPKGQQVPTVQKVGFLYPAP